MKNLLLLIMFLPAWAFGQIGGKKIDGPYKAKDGTVFNVGDTLQFGFGSSHDGKFIHIFQPPNALAGSPQYQLHPSYANKSLPIKFFKKINGRAGEFTVAIINPGGFNFVVDIENAIQTKEILTPSNSKPSDKTQLTTNKSKAEQIKELKELLDAGAINQDEYDKEKGKILNQ